MEQNKIVVFESKRIRRIWKKKNGIFRQRNEGLELSTICRQLKQESSNGNKYTTDCSDDKGFLRIIQSIPSPKME